jgi:hypothetical protein
MITRREPVDDVRAQANAIEEIAHDCGRPMGEVAEIYEVELARLGANARVRDFLLLFANRRTREVLIQRRGQRRRPPRAHA